ncbi:hypothetical protein C8F04DRAFT_940882, partial [Mycena alexandri]
VAFLAGTSTPDECWILAGLGIRFAQAVGAHHRSVYTRLDPLSAEIYKQAFWLLVVQDSIISAFKGSPSITHLTHVDLDLPVSCEHRYWELPNPVQPADKPSISAYFPAYVQLTLIFERIRNAVVRILLVFCDIIPIRFPPQYPVNGQICSEAEIVELE